MVYEGVSKLALPFILQVNFHYQLYFPKTSFIPPRMYKKYRLRRNITTFSLFFSVIRYYLMSPNLGRIGQIAG